jgi:hypothetical protein
VITATVAGLAGALGFPSRPASVRVTTIPAAGSSPVASSPPAQPRTSGPRTATGLLVNYNWGVVPVTVPVSGTKIVKLGLGALGDGLTQSLQSALRQLGV